MSIYDTMSSDWPTYNLMSAIAYIQEMSKPVKHIQIKKYKNREYRCECFRSVRLKMKNEEVVGKFFMITKTWEKQKNLSLIGNSFKEARKENWSGQDMFIFTPIWLNLLISTCGKIPNKYSYESAIERINNLKQYSLIPFSKDADLFQSLLSDKKLAAGAFVISLDLEMRGIQSGAPSLCMSHKYRDFLEFLLSVAQRWGWTNNKFLSPVDISSSLRRGIKASPQYEFRLTLEGLKEIYSLAGPVADSFKHKCIKFHIDRSNNYKNLGYHLIKRDTKQKLLNALRAGDLMSTTQLQFIAGTRVDVVLDHLHRLERENKVRKERAGKRYLWSII